MNPLAHQSAALEKSLDAFDRGVKSILLEMCCGAGKSLIMRLIAVTPFVVFVFPSLALIAQFIAKYLDLPHLVVSSEGSTDPATIVAYLASSVSQHIVCVTYNSLDVLIANLGGRVINRGIFDEAHHVGSPTYSAMIVGRTDLFNEQVHFTATPRKGVDYGERVFHFPYSKALELEMVRKFRIRVCVRGRGADGVELKDYHKLLAETAQKTGHTKGLVFSSNVAQVIAEDITCVDYFTNPELMREVLEEMDWDVELEMNKITAGTSAAERDALLARFSLVDEAFRILCSCRTLGEGIDTCLANLAMFADPKTTWEAIVQAIGRVTRRNRAIAFEDDEATAVIPVFVDAEKYAACTTADEMDTVLRENIGDFDTLRNFLAALEQSDPDLADQIINSRWTPKEVKDNAKKQGWQVGEEMSLQEALCALLETDDIDEEPDLEEVARDHEKCIVIHPDLMEEPERYYGEGEMVRLLELHDGEAYCTLTKKEKTETDDLVAPQKKNVVRFEHVLQWSLDTFDLGSSVMKYMVKKESHEERIRQLHEFYTKWGEPKYNGRRENENVLSSWISTRRYEKKKGLNTELCARMEREFSWWSWFPCMARHEQKFLLLHSFYQQFGAPRHRGIRANESALASWINTRRQDKRSGKNPELCQRLEREFPWWSWTPLSTKIESVIQQIHAFYGKFGVPRQCGKRKNEKELATWIGCRRQDRKNGRNPDLCERIEREFTWLSWDPRTDGVDSTIKKIHAFYAEHGIPMQRDGGHPNEPFLSNWMLLRRQDKKKGRNQELCARIDREFTWWSWIPHFDQQHETKIALLHTFYEKFGIPRTGNREHEHELTNWIGARRQDKKNQKNPELSERVEREFPWWSWDPRNDNLEETILQVHIFYSKFGVPTCKGIREHESKLGAWIAQIRQLKRKGKGTDLCDRCEREFPWWSWDPLSEKLEETIQKLHLFHSTFGIPRSDGKREDEAILAMWVRGRRQDKKKGTNADLCDRCEREFSWWSWDPNSDHHDEMIENLHSFHAQFGIPKLIGTRQNEKNLWSWMRRRRRDKRDDKNTELCDRIDREFPWWVWNISLDKTDETMHQLTLFYNKNGIPRRNGKRELEPELSAWINGRRQDKKKGRNPELCERIDREFPWWKWEGERSRKRKPPSTEEPELKRPKTYAAPTLNESELRAPRDPTQPCDIATDFRTMTVQQWHQKAFTTSSETLGALFQTQPAAWHAYHESRHLEYDPLDRIIEELKKARHQGVKTIADLGCGTAKLARSFYDTGDQRYNVQGFDHVAIPEWSTACDVSRCEHLMDDSFNIVVLCLGMWGTNKEETLRSAYRILETNGVLYMVEPTRRWTVEEEQSPEPAQQLVDLLKETGFDIQKAEIKEGDRILQFSFFKCTK